MLVLRRNFQFFKYLDLIYVPNRSVGARIFHSIKNTFVASLEIFLVIPSIMFFVANLADIYKALETVYAFTSFSISFGMYCFFLANKKALNDLFVELQAIIDSSKSLKAQSAFHIIHFSRPGTQNRPDYPKYEIVDRMIGRFTYIFTVFIGVMCTNVCLFPIYYTIVRFIMGESSQSDLFLPFKVV